MKRLAAVLWLLPATGFAVEFKLEGYDREVNDGTVIREAADLGDVLTVRLHCCRVSDSSLKHIARWPALGAVYLRDTAITGTGLSHLRQHANLERVGLSGPNVNDEGVKVLSQLTHVTHLSVGNGYRWDGLIYDSQITDDALKSIGRMNKIIYLSIDNSRITDAGIVELGKLPDVRSIQFFRCPGLTADGLGRLRKLRPKATISAHDPEIEKQSAQDK
jgi:hypothetical protein